LSLLALAALSLERLECSYNFVFSSEADFPILRRTFEISDKELSVSDIDRLLR